MLITAEKLDQLLLTVSNVSTSVWATEGVLQTIIVAFGVLGNLITLAVYPKLRLWHSIRYFVVPLLLADLLLLVSHWVTNAAWVLVFAGTARDYGEHVKIIPTAYVLCNVCMTASIWITALIAADRCFALWYARRYRVSNHELRMKCSVLIILLLSTLYNLPKYFEMEVVPKSTEEVFHAYAANYAPEYAAQGNSTNLLEFENATSHWLVQTQLYSHPFYMAVYRVTCCILFDTLVPFVIILTLAAIIITQTWLHNNNSSVNGSQFIANPPPQPCIGLLTRISEADVKELSASDMMLPRSRDGYENDVTVNCESAMSSSAHERSLTSVGRESPNISENVSVLPFSKSVREGYVRTQKQGSRSGPKTAQQNRLSTENQFYFEGHISHQMALRVVPTGSDARWLTNCLFGILIGYIFGHVLTIPVSIFEIAHNVAPADALGVELQQASFDDSELHIVTLVSTLAVLTNAATNWLIILCFYWRHRL